MSQKIHIIAIGGSAMHNLAIALQKKGYQVSGSDDEIFDPSKSRLENTNLLPKEFGWFPDKITSELSFIIVGKHAQKDNPELLKAQELGLQIYSMPEFIYKHSEGKHRIVVGGSHGKTTITAMIMHVLQHCERNFDYLVGAEVEGFDTMIKLSEEAPLIVIEGDEYPTSPLDDTAKFLKYEHHIGIISGVAWDHINVYPNYEKYVNIFEEFADKTPKSGSLIINQDDEVGALIGGKKRDDVTQINYTTHPHRIVHGVTYLETDLGKFPLKIFGEHNLKNISASKEVCLRIGVKEEEFYYAITTFEGAKRRLEKIGHKKHTNIFHDFAHAPSKLKASVEAVKQQFSDRKLVACIELHTFSSLDKKFLKEYAKTYKMADEPIVYYNPKTIEHKKLEMLSPSDIKEGFAQENLIVLNDIVALEQYILERDWSKTNLLMMSSGNFDGLNVKKFAEKVLDKV